MSDRIEIAGVTDAPVFDVGVLDALLIWLSDKGGSDAALISGETPTVRLDGEWRRVGHRVVSPEELALVLQSIYQQSALAILQGGVQLDFRHVVRVRRGVRYGYRANAVAGLSSRADMGIKITFRAIPSQPPSFDDLGFEDLLRDNAMPSFGLVLVSGPTGSGKSTTLASIIRRRIETLPENVQTFEAPVEFDYEAVKNKKGLVFQSEVGPNVESFEAGVAGVLRMAPDVILIGEARDRATIEGLVRSAITGHAVYSTTHTNSVAMTIPRMTDEFPRDSRWAMAVNLIDATRLSIHQRLLRRPDGGRVAVREMLVFDEQVRSTLFAAGSDRYVRETKRLVQERGQPLIADVEAKYRQGLIAEGDYRRLVAELGRASDAA